MESLIISFNAIVPMFLIIAIGYTFKSIGWITPAEVKRFNKIVFHTFMSAMLFRSIYNSDLSKLMDPGYLIFVLVSVMITFVIAVLAVLPLEKDGAKRGAMIHAAYRSNYILLGTPIVAALTSDGDTGMAAVVASITIPLYTILAVIMLEYFRSGKLRLNGMLKSLAKNPLIIASVAGIIVKIAGIQLPGVLESVVSKLNSAASPVALLLLGASFDWKQVASERRNIAISTVLRLVIFPAVMLTAGAIIGYRGVEFVTLIPLFASPTAVNTFNMDQEMGADLNIASGAIAISTALSFVTLFIWVSLFKHLGMI